ncbi:hypothetical protein dsx2_2440 [Desulfovibrio sp. X2]|uniref:hypothetical protein n=1 Tax=Desulfovibrio sp. X2 TaxID=941449 RepID=UPI000358A963|nr:hypothetical protein [Desulfovibrio sp. X2]EPR43080.1 hypothetical protein dsx2_2440 [Desulfovibrio sp. X2]
MRATIVLCLCLLLLPACSPIDYSAKDHLVKLADSRLAHDKLLLAPGWDEVSSRTTSENGKTSAVALFKGKDGGEQLGVLYEPVSVEAEPGSDDWIEWNRCDDQAFCDTVYTFFDAKSCALVAYYMVPALHGRYVVSFSRGVQDDNVPCDAWENKDFFSERQEELYEDFLDRADQAFRPVAR